MQDVNVNYTAIKNALIKQCERDNLKLLEGNLKDKEFVFKRIDNIFILNSELR